MIHLIWDWGICIGVASSGGLVGFFLGAAAWPVRVAAGQRPPVLLALALSLSIWAAFFGSLAAFRIVAGQVAELQATVLYLVFIGTGAIGLALRSLLIRPGPDR